MQKNMEHEMGAGIIEGITGTLVSPKQGGESPSRKDYDILGSILGCP